MTLESHFVWLGKAIVYDKIHWRSLYAIQNVNSDIQIFMHFAKYSMKKSRFITSLSKYDYNNTSGLCRTLLF